MQTESTNPSAHPYRFNFTDTDAWKAHLKDKGFAVVYGLVSEEDAERITEEMKECLQKFSPNLTDEKSWTVGKNYPFMLHGGMVQYMGHAKFQWECREKVAPIFAKIWECETKHLATSFDGFCYMNGKRKYRAQDPLSFVHTDQSPTRDYLWSVQGLLNLKDCAENDGGLILIPESHKHHGEVFKRLGLEGVKDDWHKFSEDQKKDAVFTNYVKICGKAGDFMMWDSRTLHCNTVPTSQNVRACVYVCQIPKIKVPEKALKKRKTAWLAKRCSGHHPGDGFSMFPAVPRYGDQEIKKIAPEISVVDEDLTELQKSLLYVE